MKYTPEDLPVLKNLHLVIESGWKVSILKIYFLMASVKLQYLLIMHFVRRWESLVEPEPENHHLYHLCLDLR